MMHYGVDSFVRLLPDVGPAPGPDEAGGRGHTVCAPWAATDHPWPVHPFATTMMAHRIPTSIARLAPVIPLILACAAPQGAGGSSSEPANGTTSPIAITVDRETYSPGAEVGLRIENRSDSRFGYNACPRRVEREADSGWVTIPEPDRVCTMEIRMVEPRSTKTDRTDLPGALEPGRYRLLISFLQEPEAGAAPGEPRRVLAASNVFRVQ
jgi:hypothetical protein